MDTPYGDFNFFSRPSHWTMTMHKHPFFQFLLVISGDLKIITGQSETLLERGMVSIIPPEVPHNLMSEAGYNQFGINLISDAPEDSLIKILTSYIDAPVIINNPGLLDLLPEIEDCARLQTMVSIQKIRNRLEYMLLNCVEMIKRQDTNQAFREKLMDYFRERLSENLALEELSKDFFMSPSHIERLSYMEFGCGAMHLFNRLKMDRARMLLQNTNLPISDISGRLGYEDQGYFSRVFRKYAGMSPRKYQKWRKM
ncbi:MAG: helix-turn-helix domain-containing protein [Treponema sp.]|nr:helix-turn-helix domain-containing protein [Treponema sp.]